MDTDEIAFVKRALAACLRHAGIVGLDIRFSGDPETAHRVTDDEFITMIEQRCWRLLGEHMEAVDVPA